ncbi:MAG TPA: hypothetical protein VGQ83_39755 [Polyangia bacterium]|jgi:hypothetical protein
MPDRREFLAWLGRGALAGAGAFTVGCGAGRLGLPPRSLTPSHVGYGPRAVVDRVRAGRRAGDPFIVGAARLTITPPDLRQIWVAGYGFERKARGVLDPLTVRAFYFDDGVRPLWLVSADVIGFQLPSVERIRRLISPTWGENALVCATHNHDGPDTIGFWGPSLMYLLPVQSGIDVRYLTWLERVIAVCAQRATQAAVPATLRLGRAPLPADIVNLREPGVHDKEMTVLEAVARGGDSLATLLFFPCHAEALADDNHYLSADFPGFMYRAVEARRGGVAGFFQGAEGAMVTSRFDRHWPLARRYRYIQTLGGELGRRAALALAAARPLPAPRLERRRQQVIYPIATDMYRLIAKLKLPLLERSLASGGMQSEVTVATLGPVTLAAVPGEPSPAIGAQIQAALKGEHRLVLGLANDEVGYLLTEEQFRDPKYQYEAGVSPGPDAGPRTLAAVRALA